VSRTPHDVPREPPRPGRGSRRRPAAAGLALALAAGLGAAVLTAREPADAATWETVIDSSSLQSYQALEKEWNYLYPWGSDHNGSARMYGSTTDHNHVYLSDGNLVLKATRITWDEGRSTAKPNLPIRYHSGAVHAKEKILVSDQFPNYEVKGDFQAPSAPGTWPAFWLTGADSWPPESDILEFKGDNRNWFNTFRTSSDVSSTIVPVNSPGSWHTYRIWMTKVSATDVEIHYYLDGVWKAKHRAGFVGKPLWLIVNLQMEGSSGSSGPSADTLYRARNLYVGRSRA
jgi:galactan endo-beta-1,3-galactanase